MYEKIKSYRFSDVLIPFLGAFILIAAAGSETMAKSKRGWLGVGVEEMTPSMREELEVEKRGGLLITQVFDDSPADDAGFREDDVIVKYNGKKVEKIDEFVLLVRNTAPNTSVKINFVRRGKDKEADVTIGRKKRRNFSFFGFNDHAGKLCFSGGPRLGVQVHELNEDLAAYFKGGEPGSVLILKVIEDSPAEKAGLKAGDVITKIDETQIDDPQELTEILEDYEEEDVVKVGYIRKGKKESINIKLENASGFQFHGFNGLHNSKIRIREFGDDEVWAPEILHNKNGKLIQIDLNDDSRII